MVANQSKTTTSQRKADPDGLRQQYTEINNNLRHYSGLRFAMLSIYFAVLGGVISVAFGLVGGSEASQVRPIAKWGGLVVTFVFFVFECLSARTSSSLREAAKTLEEDMGYYQWRSNMRLARLRAIYFTIFLYGVVFLFLVYSIFRLA